MYLWPSLELWTAIWPKEGGRAGPCELHRTIWKRRRDHPWPDARRGVRWRAERCIARQEKRGSDGCHRCQIWPTLGWTFLVSTQNHNKPKPSAVWRELASAPVVLAAHIQTISPTTSRAGTPPPPRHGAPRRGASLDRAHLEARRRHRPRRRSRGRGARVRRRTPRRWPQP